MHIAAPRSPHPCTRRSYLIASSSKRGGAACIYTGLIADGVLPPDSAHEYPAVGLLRMDVASAPGAAPQASDVAPVVTEAQEVRALTTTPVENELGCYPLLRGAGGAERVRLAQRELLIWMRLSAGEEAPYPPLAS